MFKCLVTATLSCHWCFGQLVRCFSSITSQWAHWLLIKVAVIANKCLFFLLFLNSYNSTRKLSSPYYSNCITLLVKLGLHRQKMLIFQLKFTVCVPNGPASFHDCDKFNSHVRQQADRSDKCDQT